MGPLDSWDWGRGHKTTVQWSASQHRFEIGGGVCALVIIGRACFHFVANPHISTEYIKWVVLCHFAKLTYCPGLGGVRCERLPTFKTTASASIWNTSIGTRCNKRIVASQYRMPVLARANCTTSIRHNKIWSVAIRDAQGSFKKKEGLELGWSAWKLIRSASEPWTLAFLVASTV